MILLVKITHMIGYNENFEVISHVSLFNLVIDVKTCTRAEVIDKTT